MTAPRDLVVCRACGAVLGRVERNRGPQRRGHLFVRAGVVLVVVLAQRVDMTCPQCGQCRSLSVEQFPVIAREAA